MNLRKKLIIGLVLILMIAAAVFGSRILFIKSIGKNSGSIRPTDYQQNPFIPDFESLAVQVKKSLVNVNAERADAVRIRNPFDNFYYGNDAFQDRLNRNGSRWSSLGSGFIVNSDGYILTNSHVIENASRINVRLADRRILKATVVGTDPKIDLAVLKIQSSNLPVLHLESSDTVAVGDWVAAFGRPFGLEETVSAGIISAKGRAVGLASSDKLLQTDAVINPENSGGPLVNMQGEVVGINTAIAGRNRGFSGIGFAIPADAVWRAYDRLIQTGKAARGWMGVLLQDVTPEIAKVFGLNRLGGALVSEAAPDGPAAKAGITSGDIILEYNGQPVRNRHDLSSAVTETKAGTSIPIKVLRNGKQMIVHITVGERPSDAAQHFTAPRMREPGKLGITVESLTPEIQSTMHLSSSNGVLVIDVIPGSAADNGGIQPGDIIHAINHTPVYAATDLLAMMRKLNEDSTVLLHLERQGKVFYSAFRLY
jgi:serine protease Do